MAVNVRPAEESDVPVLLELIMQLAIYENEPDQVKITAEQLVRDGFRSPQRFHCLIGELDGKPVAYALYFYIYSTWEGLSMYLEDLFVLKEARGRGVGLALCRAVTRAAQDSNCARLQWQVIDWNDSAIKFYKEVMGAEERVESSGKWLNYIMRRDAISTFATRPTGAAAGATETSAAAGQAQ